MDFQTSIKQREPSLEKKEEPILKNKNNKKWYLNKKGLRRIYYLYILLIIITDYLNSMDFIRRFWDMEWAPNSVIFELAFEFHFERVFDSFFTFPPDWSSVDGFFWKILIPSIIYSGIFWIIKGFKKNEQ